jgi:outer membrane biosynthesis protein TonB
MSGPEIFQETSLKAVRKWRFHPVMIKGQAVETTYEIDLQI